MRYYALSLGLTPSADNKRPGDDPSPPAVTTGGKSNGNRRP